MIKYHRLCLYLNHLWSLFQFYKYKKSSKYRPYTLREYEDMKKAANVKLGGLVINNHDLKYRVLICFQMSGRKRKTKLKKGQTLLSKSNNSIKEISFLHWEQQTKQCKRRQITLGIN